MSESVLDASSELKPVQQVLNQLISNNLNLSWDDYYQLVNQLPTSFKIAPSLKLLNLADGLMNQLNSGLLESTLIERFLIGGVADKNTIKEFGLDTELLGNMSGFPSFKKVLKNDAEGVQKLLRIIPANGRIDGWHFMQFSDGYRDLFAANGIKQAPIYPATRLLSMKRPDQFVCIHSNTDLSFYQALGTKELKKQDFQRYWDDIITPLQRTPWFKQDLPMDVAQLAIYRSRVCLLERILNQPDETYVEAQTDSMINTHVDSDAQTDVSTAEFIAAPSDFVNSSDIRTDTSTEQDNNKPTASSFTAKSVDNNIVSKNGVDIDQTKAAVYQNAKQPKKMTIAKRKSAKVNKNAATKLMSQYYFANKAKYAKVDINSKRDLIIDKLCEGESVEDAFAAILTV